MVAPNGRLIVAVPASDDMIELRAHVQGEGVPRERADAVEAEHAERFAVVERRAVRTRHRLEGGALRDLLRGTYRGARASAARRVEALEALDVTVASELLVLSPRRHAV